MEFLRKNFTALPCDVICGSIFPLLSVHDLQALDTSFTNKDLRSHLRSLWKAYEYDCMDHVFEFDVAWLCNVGARIISVCLASNRRIITSLAGLSISLKKLAAQVPISNEVLVAVAETCPHIEVLELSCEDYSEHGLISVAQHCHQLHTISWYGDLDPDAITQALCYNCPHLRHIHITIH